MQPKLYWRILVFVLISFAPQPLTGNETVWRSIGLRGGVDDNRNDENFKQYEVFLTLKLPWIGFTVKKWQHYFYKKY